jgi:hypothetical protein
VNLGVRDHSDKGAIATMNEFCVRALQRKIDGLKKAPDAIANPAVRTGQTRK